MVEEYKGDASRFRDGGGLGQYEVLVVLGFNTKYFAKGSDADFTGPAEMSGLRRFSKTGFINLSFPTAWPVHQPAGPLFIRAATGRERSKKQ